MTRTLRLSCAVLLLALSCTSSAMAEEDAISDPSGASAVAAAAGRSLAYPATRRDPLVETKFGINVADPYRWLEDDARVDPAVAAWITSQNGVTQAYLSGLPGRDALRARMTALYDYERFGIPKKGGTRYFYTHNSGLQKQSPLFMRDGLDGTARLLLDPAKLSADGSSALVQWEPSADGHYLLYAVQDKGSDWRALRVIDVDGGEVLPDRIDWARYSNLTWRQDGRGFFYAGFDPARSRAGQTSLGDHRIYYHALGTPQAADLLIYSTPGQPALRHAARVTDDGRWLLILSSEGTGDPQDVMILSLTDKDAKPRRLVHSSGKEWSFAGSDGDQLFFRTDYGARRGRLVMLDAAHPGYGPVPLVAEQGRELVGASLVGDRLILAYLSEGHATAEMVDLAGHPAGKMPMPGIGTGAGFLGRSGDSETFFRFSDFTMPDRIYRFDTATNRIAPFAAPRLPFDPAAFVTEVVSFPSRDGTLVPLYLVRRKDMVGKAAPTLLYGYGGFAKSVTPTFSPTRLAWVEQGGVLAIAALRGGGEYGKAWYDAGRLANKQNVFDDFIAAAEYLKAKGITGADQLAIEGRSNGGLLVGAVLNQRPDLFAAALPSVGVMDMLRFNQFTAGRYWVDDYGDPARKADFQNLLSYSPYHNVQGGRPYPAILVTAADSDDRVVPAHSFKYTAALQNADIGERPHLIRIETGEGHGAGKSVDKAIEEASDMYSFIAYWTGLKIEPK
jgi:prolyl oligopeptidase